jgi:ABC-2 type transport system ATP-binding protein
LAAFTIIPGAPKTPSHAPASPTWPTRRTRGWRASREGRKQWVYVALALVDDPAALFLDEPTTGLDVDARRAVWDAIRQQIGRGKTLILATHHLDEADALARRMVVIHRGRIIADGTPVEIKRRVGGAHVRFRAENVTEAELRALPHTQRVEALGAHIRLCTQQPEAVLAQLFQRGAQLHDLEVIGAGLEDAFLTLTSADGQAQSSHARLGMESSRTPYHLVREDER